MTPLHADFQRQLKELQQKRQGLSAAAKPTSSLAPSSQYDGEVYESEGGNGTEKYSGYVASIAATAEEDAEDEEDIERQRRNYTGSTKYFDETAHTGPEEDPFQQHRRSRIADREDEYRQQRFKRIISPERQDPFAEEEASAASNARSYAEIMQEKALDEEAARVRKKIAEQLKEKRESGAAGEGTGADSSGSVTAAHEGPATKRSRRWDEAPKDASSSSAPTTSAAVGAKSRWDQDGASNASSSSGVSSSRWDAVPDEEEAGATPKRRNRWDETPRSTTTSEDATPRSTGWGETPARSLGGETPSKTGEKKKSRWDETPSNFTGATPAGSAALGMATPTPSAALNIAAMTPEQIQAMRWERDLDERNRPLTDEELDTLFPDGYKVLDPPASYQPIRTPGRRLIATPTPSASLGYSIPEEETDKSKFGVTVAAEDPTLPALKPEDQQYFGALLEGIDESGLDAAAQRDRLIMKLLLRIKNGTPVMRKQALRQITDNSRHFGAGPLFNQVLPLLMSPALEDQERHLLVKVICPCSLSLSLYLRLYFFHSFFLPSIYIYIYIYMY